MFGAQICESVVMSHDRNVSTHYKAASFCGAIDAKCAGCRPCNNGRGARVLFKKGPPHDKSVLIGQVAIRYNFSIVWQRPFGECFPISSVALRTKSEFLWAVYQGDTLMREIQQMFRGEFRQPYAVDIEPSVI